MQNKNNNPEPKNSEWRGTAPDLSVCARYGVLLEGESPLHTRQGEVLAEGKGVVVRRSLEKAYKQTIAQEKACYANNRKGPCWNAGIPVVKQALSPEYFKRLEFYSMTDNLKRLRTTLT